MPDQLPVNIVMIEDDEGHARLIEKNIRRAGISNTIHHFSTEIRRSISSTTANMALCATDRR